MTYVVRDPQGTACAVVDSVLDFDYASGRTDTRAADAVVLFPVAQQPATRSMPASPQGSQ